jgi:hypothetical protein
MQLINAVSEEMDKEMKKKQILTGEEAKELNRLLDKMRG